MGADLMLGIDTGGTYTDAVLVTDDAVPQIVDSAKALTTHHNLATGISEAMLAVTTSVDPGAITLVSVSTTLATNAIVEGQGGSVCLITMGFSPTDLTRGGLADAIGGGSTITTPGGHTSHGDELASLDLGDLDRQLDALPLGQLSGFAVVSQFAVRNPSHEQAVRSHLRDRFDLGVTCSYELSAQLNGPKRAVTAVLNARLIGLISDLVTATRSSMTAHQIDAPLMVVRGDGSLISAELATDRPIETILSGPAASVIGARHLASEYSANSQAGHMTAPDTTNAIVSDIGGTTTDLAVMTDGRVEIDPTGASVGGHDTMVEAIAIRTIGLGGDSEVAVDDAGPTTRLTLGPRRVIPLSLLATQHPNLVMPVLGEQRRSMTTPWLAATFAALRHQPSPDQPLTDLERFVIDGLASGPRPLRDLLPTRRHEIALDGLIRSGLVARSSFTPTDAAHVLGLHEAFDRDAAITGADLMARKQDRRGAVIASDGPTLALLTIAELQRRTVHAVLGIALGHDGFDDGTELHPLVSAGLDGHSNHVAIDLRLETTLIGLGASAPTYYPEVARRLGAELFLPEHAGVANAVGAIVGKVRILRTTTITRKKNGAYVANGVAFADLDDAANATEVHLNTEVGELAERAGAHNPELTIERTDNVVQIDGQDFFVDATITVTGTGRPRRA